MHRLVPQRFVTMLALALLATGCSDAGWIAGQGPVVRSSMVSIDRVTIADDPQTATVTFVAGPAGDIIADPCNGDYELDVDEGTSPPTVTVWELRPSVPPRPPGNADEWSCELEGFGWELEHRWAGEVPAEIRDGATGKVQRVIRTSELLEPDVLPQGWTVVSTRLWRGGYTSELTDGFTTVIVAATPHPGPADEIAPVWSGPDASDITVRDGTPAQTNILDGYVLLRFVERGYGYQLAAPSEVGLDPLTRLATWLGLSDG